MQELIDKQASMKAICDGCFKSRAVDIELKCRGTCNVIDILQQQPTIEAEPVRHGRWIVHTTWHGMFGLIHSECSECKFDRNGDLSSWKFCPNCGARMDLRTPAEVQLDEADSVMMGGADNG